MQLDLKQPVNENAKIMGILLTIGKKRLDYTEFVNVFKVQLSIRSE